MDVSNTIIKKICISSLLLLVLILLCYNLSIKKAINAYRVYRTMISSSESPCKIQNDINSLQSDINNIAKELGESNLSVNKRNILIEKISEFSEMHRINVIEMPPSHLLDKEGYLIETNMIKLQGSFIGIVTTVHKLEKEKFIGRILSIRYYALTNRITKSRELFAEIFVQNITSTGYE